MMVNSIIKALKPEITKAVETATKDIVKTIAKDISKELTMLMDLHPRENTMEHEQW